MTRVVVVEDCSNFKIWCTVHPSLLVHKFSNVSTDTHPLKQRASEMRVVDGGVQVSVVH